MKIQGSEYLIYKKLKQTECIKKSEHYIKKRINVFLRYLLRAINVRKKIIAILKENLLVQV